MLFIFLCTIIITLAVHIGIRVQPTSASNCRTEIFFMGAALFFLFYIVITEMDILSVRAIYLFLCIDAIALSITIGARLNSIKLKWWDEIFFVAAALSFLFCIVAVFYYLGIRANFTPSMPKGLYVLEHGTDQLQRGDLVTYCLEPDNPYSALAKEREYVGPGSCPNGLKPLLKRLAGLPGDQVELTVEGLQLNNLLLANTKRPDNDSQGRPLPPSLLHDGVIPDGLALVISQDHAGSFDSRHFGLVNIHSLQKVEPVLVNY